MKTMKAGAVVLLGLVLAAPAWGHWRPGVIPAEVFVAVNGNVVTVGWRSDEVRDAMAVYGGSCVFNIHVGEKVINGMLHGIEFWETTPAYAISDWPQSFTYTRLDRLPERARHMIATMYCDSNGVVAHAHKQLDGTLPEPETPEPETPEPEPPEPEPPEPETPEPEACPAEPRCDHLAIVAAMPRALPGDEEAADHWVRITNPGAASIRFTIEGRDESGAKGGTYRRELPAYRSVKVKMRDIQAAFDVTDPEGWWWLRVAGSGPIGVAATMKQGDARRFVPIKVPATCGTGPVTRPGD